MRPRFMYWLGVVGVVGLCLLPSASAQQPHRQFTTVVNTDTASSAQSATTIWTPTSGKMFILQGVMVSAETPVSVRFQVSGTDVIPPIILDSNGTVVVDASGYALFMSATDAVLTYTTTSTALSLTHPTISVMTWGYEAQR